jgi:hypothetical protein
VIPLLFLPIAWESEPGDTPERENVLMPGDLITGVEIPPVPIAERADGD